MEMLSGLTNMIAAHGVYALSVIFIFYQQRRAVKNLIDSRESSDKRYFRKVNTSVLVATYILVAASTGVWFYATFMHEPVKMITGEVVGLRSKSAAPSNGITVYQQIAPELNDLDFYPVEDFASLVDGGYRFRWAVFAKEDVRQLAFRFVHKVKGPPRVSALSPIPAAASASSSEEKPIANERSIERRFVLDLGTSYSLRRPIQLTYKADEDDLMKVGNLWMNRPDGSVLAVDWARQPAAAPARSGLPLSRLFERFSLATLLAQSDVMPVFKSDGSYNADTGRALVIQLGSADLRTRLSARQMLVQAAPRSHRFINDVLSKKVTVLSSDGAALLDSMSSVIDEIEVRGSRFAPEGQLKLAEAFYDAGDYQAAAYRFERAGNITGGDPENLARRGHSFVETGSLAKAIQAFNDYLAGALSREQRVWALNALGVAYRRAGRLNESVAAEREAFKVDPNSTTALNGLAYTYAKQGKYLSEALTLIDRALKQQPNSADLQETRAYVLYKLGRVSEALPLMRRSAAMLPNDPDAQNDLKEVEEAVRLRGAKPTTPTGLPN